MNETFHDEVVAEHKKRWTRSTRKLSLGVAFATVLMLLYSILLYIPTDNVPAEGSDISGRTLAMYAIYVVLGIALAFLCIQNYLRGLSRFATCFEGGGKRSLFLIRWGFLITIAGVILQIFVYFVINAIPSTFLRLLVGNLLLAVGAVVGIMGFLSLATSKGMTDKGRKGALHMSWTTLILLGGALLLSYSLHQGLLLKIVCTLVNVSGALLFFYHWKQIVRWPEEKPEEPAEVESNTPEANHEAEENTTQQESTGTPLTDSQPNEQ